MDSLLLVLAVLAVVMILVGIARAKSKRSQKWDEVDHSVLFTKSSSGGGAAHVEPNLGDNVDFGDDGVGPVRIVQREAPEPVEVEEVSSASARVHEPRSKRSFFDKLIGEDGEEDDEEITTSEPVRVYKEGAPEWVIIFNVMAPDECLFTGEHLQHAAEELGLRHGEMDIFHYKKNGVQMFSMANMVNPGTFKIETMASFTTPGVSFFIQLPNQYGNGVDAFNNMLAVAQGLAENLGGDIRDERRSVLTHSAIDHLREKVAEYDMKWHLNH